MSLERRDVTGKLLYVLHPVPIKKEDYLRAMDSTPLKPGSAEAQGHLELTRVHDLLERFFAFLNPHSFVRGPKGDEVAWEVRFPSNSRWKSGPPTRGGPLNAIYANYQINKFFAGYMMDSAHDPSMFLNADKIKDEALKERRTREEEAAHEDALRQQRDEPGSTLHLGRPQPD